ncbi:unnamed protein product, partial [Polarella glacialis]
AAKDPHACSVLDKALSYGSQEDQGRLAQQVIEEQGLLATMANLRGGFAATQRLFKVVDGHLLKEARSQLQSRAIDISRTKHGRALVNAVLPEFALSPLPSVPSPSRAQRGPSRRSAGGN